MTSGNHMEARSNHRNGHLVRVEWIILKSALGVFAYFFRP